LRVVLRGEGDGVALRLFTERVAEVIARATTKRHGQPVRRRSPCDDQLAVRAMAGQITEVLRWWTDADVPGEPRLPRDHVVAQLRTVANIGRFAADDPRRHRRNGEEQT
jgi:hypothetical protein